ncbi:hypothetical protein LCGC14_0588710, partial [marine sediment metagenome]
MAELFSESGQSSDVGGSAPTLRGVFIPGIDRATFPDGLGLVTPLGGGGSLRNYTGYGPSAGGSPDFTQLLDLTNALGSFGSGSGFDVSFEGFVGPTGPPGPPGPSGLPGTGFSFGTPSYGLLALPDDLEKIDGLVTDADRMLYTSGYTLFEEGWEWTERQPAGDSDGQWQAVASDLDGSNLIAAARSGRLWTSSDSGVNWTERQPAGASNKFWTGVASDDTGLKLIAVEDSGVWTSVDSGVNWTERQPTGGATTKWNSVASDSDGSNLIVSKEGSGGQIYTSSDSGVNWTLRDPSGAGDKNWASVDSDSDGSNLIAAYGPGRLYTSSDSGDNWIERQPAGASDHTWRDVVSDNDGSNLIVGNSTRLWTSSDSGVNWTERQPAGNNNYNWWALVSNSDGSVLMAGISTGRLYASTDSGVSWEETQPAGDGDKEWRGLAADSGGHYIIAGVNTGRLYTSIPPISYSQATWAETDVTQVARNFLDDLTQAAQQTTIGLGTGDSPEFTGLTVSGLTASRITATGASKELVSLAKPLIIDEGGTGLSTITNHGILLGSGTAAITPLGVASNGQLPIGSAGADPVLAALTGTTNQITVTNGVGSITLSTPQDIHTTASNFTVAGATISDLTQGSVVFAGASGAISQDNSNLFWDDTNNRLGVGVNSGFDPRVGITISGDMDILHTATEPDDHAFEVDVDAATLGDVKAIDIVYTTGILVAGRDEGIILVNIDETVATGGDVFGLEILSTDGSAEIYGMKVGAVISPIRQDSGTFANPTTATDNTTGPADVAAMKDGDIGTTTAIFENQNEYILIGAAAAFQEVEFILTTGSSGAGIKPTFWYSTAGAHQFTQFTPVDGTNAFRNTGVVAWDASDLTSHGINTDTGTYDIKVIRTRSSLSTPPVLGYAKTAATVEYLWDKNGDVNINSLTLATVAAEGSDVDKFLVDSSGVVKYRTGTQVLSDIGGQAQGDVLDDLNILGAVVSDGQFLVGTGAGAFAYESGA